MTIQTEFTIYDDIFFIYENKVVKDSIYSIEITKYHDNSGSTIYKTFTHYKGKRLEFKESDNLLFATKEELLNSL